MVYGLYDSEGNGFAGRTKSTMMSRALNGERPAPDVLVHAVHGRTLPHILSCMPHDVMEFSKRKSVGVFMVGASDSRSSTADAAPVVPLPEFRNHLAQLGRMCTELAVAPIFVGFPHIDDRFTQPFRPTGEHFNDARLQEYTLAVEEHAALTGATFIPTYDALGGAEMQDLYLANDRLHLNQEGHTVLHSLVVPAIDAALAPNYARV